MFFLLAFYPYFIYLTFITTLLYYLYMTPLQRRILTLLKDRDTLRPTEMMSLLGVSRTALYEALRYLVEREYLVRSGSRPYVLYSLVPDFSEDIQDSFLYRSVSGELLFGMKGFRVWSKERFPSLSFEEKIRLYESSYATYMTDRVHGFQFSVPKLVAITPTAFSSLHCLDTYQIQVAEEKKRTKPAVLLDAAKTDIPSLKRYPQAYGVFSEYLTSSVKSILSFLETFEVGGIAFVPPTRRRHTQFMRLLEREFFRWNSRAITRVTIERNFNSSSVRLEQKSISSTKGRIENARTTYRVAPLANPHKTVLLVDDLVGSGATMNEVARKLLESGVAETVRCLGLVGINTKKLVVVRSS